MTKLKQAHCLLYYIILLVLYMYAWQSLCTCIAKWANRECPFLSCSLFSCHFWKNYYIATCQLAIARISYNIYKIYLNLIDVTQMKLIIILMVAILNNDCHSYHRTNLRWPYSQKFYLGHLLTVYQILCFCHKMHDFTILCPISAVLVASLPVCCMV